MPGSVWLRQRLDRVSSALLAPVDEMSVRLIERAAAPITPHKGNACLDMDTFVMDQSCSQKEEISRSYQGVDGYTPVATYLGNEGWCAGLELRPGRWHSSLEIEYFLERLLPRVEPLVPAEQPVLMCKDSGFDCAKLLFAAAAEKERWAAMDRRFEYLVKWNPRRQDKDAWIAQAEAAGAFVETPFGQTRSAVLRQCRTRLRQKNRHFRLVERTIDKRGQLLLLPDIELEGWWASLDDEEATVIKRYRDHGPHEQFHSEFKTDLDLERLPSGKFDTSDWACWRTTAYGCLDN